MQATHARKPLAALAAIVALFALFAVMPQASAAQTQAAVTTGDGKSPLPPAATAPVGGDSVTVDNECGTGWTLKWSASGTELRSEMWYKNTSGGTVCFIARHINTWVGVSHWTRVCAWNATADGTLTAAEICVAADIRDDGNYAYYAGPVFMTGINSKSLQISGEVFWETTGPGTLHERHASGAVAFP